MTKEISSPLDFFKKWTPRLICAAIGGYYGLGFAYEYGLMTKIDRIAIRIIKHFFGYVGIGALMPTVQWYAAWGVRIVIAFFSALTYSLAEKCFLFFTSRVGTLRVVDGKKSLESRQVQAQRL